MKLGVAVACTFLPALAQAQEATVARLRAFVVTNDSVALRTTIRERPDDARELVRLLLIDASRSEARRTDSVLVLANRVSGAFAAAWEDSFLVAQVARFARMNPAQRAAKIAADSIRRAGNDALGRHGVYAALAIWRQALARSTAAGDSAGIAAALGNIGSGFYRSSRLDSAVLYLNRAQAMAAAVGDQRTALNALAAMGSAARDRGNLQEAETIYNRTLELRERIGDERGVAADHNNLGLVTAGLGQVAVARKHYENAVAVAREHDLEEPAAIAQMNLGNLASDEANFSEAAKHYGDALEIYRSSARDADAALVLHNLGLLAMRRGDYTTASGRLREALVIFNRFGTVEDVVLVRRDLAAVAAAEGDLQTALLQLRLAERRLGRRDRPSGPQAGRFQDPYRHCASLRKASPSRRRLEEA